MVAVGATAQKYLFELRGLSSSQTLYDTSPDSCIVVFHQPICPNQVLRLSSNDQDQFGPQPRADRLSNAPGGVRQGPDTMTGYERARRSRLRAPLL
jgi:hypothetical protein